MEALVVFTRENCHWMGGILHPDFRHVYCVVPTADSDCWTEVNLTSRYGIRLTSMGGSLSHIEACYWELPEVTTAVRVPYEPEERHLLPHILNNCVGLTKQIIGRRDLSLTPHQFYRQLRKEPIPCVSISH